MRNVLRKWEKLNPKGPGIVQDSFPGNFVKIRLQNNSKLHILFLFV